MTNKGAKMKKVGKKVDKKAKKAAKKEARRIAKEQKRQVRLQKKLDKTAKKAAKAFLKFAKLVLKLNTDAQVVFSQKVLSKKNKDKLTAAVKLLTQLGKQKAKPVQAKKK